MTKFTTNGYTVNSSQHQNLTHKRYERKDTQEINQLS
jgi:hypothetical protein